MDSINNLPDVQTKPPDFAANILSSLSADLASGNPIDKLFSNLLSGVQTPAPPPNPAPDTSTAAASSSPPSQQNASSAETGSAPQADNTNNNNTAVAASSGNAAQPPAGGKLAGKFLRHEAKTHADKGKPHNADHKSSRSSPSSAAATANNQLPAAGDPASSGSKNAADTTDLLTNPATDPAVDPTSDPSTTPTGSDQNANAQNTPSTADASPAGSDNTTSNGNTTVNGGDVTMSELLLLLSQLEQFAARQLTGTPANAAAPLANAGTNQSANSAPAAATGSTDAKQSPSDRSGLEGLLATLGRLDNAGAGNANGQNGSNQTNASLDTTQTPAATTASLQNTVSQASRATASNTGNGWPAGFFDLFNSALGNPANAPLPTPGFVPGTATLGASDGGDGPSLDMDMQGQNGAASRNAAADAATNNALTPLTTGAPPASPYDFASQLSALRLAKGGDTGLPAPVEQVILQMGRGARDGSNQMTIQLRPAELGRVDVKLNISADGKVQGTVTADNPTTLGLLLKDVRSLERALQEAGLRADSGSLQFNLRGDGQTGGGGFDQTAGQTNSGNSQADAATSLAVPADAGEPYYLTPGGVNMRV